MREARRFAAVDLGAESGRVVVGQLDGDRVALEECHRFANRPLWLPDGLHWNLPMLFTEVLVGLGEAARGGPLDGVGVDAWGCDYALLDGGNRMLGLPFHYRDARTAGAAVAGAHERVSREELYGRTGIQTMPINTVFQLSAESGGAAAVAERIALIPDLIAHWLTGTLANELTIASTTGLLEAQGDRWARDLVQRLGLPSRPFQGTTTPPGTELGAVLAGHADTAVGAVGAIVRTVAGHDTACAFAATPVRGEHAAVLSSGTWSLLGVELTEPQLGTAAAAANLTNERGVDGTTRLLRNVMGLWLVQECRRAWGSGSDAQDYDELHQLAARARPDVPVFDPDQDQLLRGGDMPSLIAAACARSGQPPPTDRGEMVRSILVSLACRYRMVLEQLAEVSGRRIEVIHVVGGGARNALLCQLTADLTGMPVLAGPTEATALGNVMVQARAVGELTGLGQIRELAARSVSLRRFDPTGAQPAAETYQRFLAAIGPATLSRTTRTAAQPAAASG